MALTSLSLANILRKSLGITTIENNILVKFGEGNKNMFSLRKIVAVTVFFVLMFVFIQFFLTENLSILEALLISGFSTFLLVIVNFLLTGPSK